MISFIPEKSFVLAGVHRVYLNVSRVVPYKTVGLWSSWAFHKDDRLNFMIPVLYRTYLVSLGSASEGLGTGTRSERPVTSITVSTNRGDLCLYFFMGIKEERGREIKRNSDLGDLWSVPLC